MVLVDYIVAEVQEVLVYRMIAWVEKVLAVHNFVLVEMAWGDYIEV